MKAGVTFTFIASEQARKLEQTIKISQGENESIAQHIDSATCCHISMFGTLRKPKNAISHSRSRWACIYHYINTETLSNLRSRPMPYDFARMLGCQKALFPRKTLLCPCDVCDFMVELGQGAEDVINTTVPQRPMRPCVEVQNRNRNKPERSERQKGAESRFDASCH